MTSSYFPTSQFQSPTYYFSPSPPSSSTNSPNSLTHNFHFPLKTFYSGSPENFLVRSMLDLWSCGQSGTVSRLWFVSHHSTCGSVRRLLPHIRIVSFLFLFFILNWLVCLLYDFNFGRERKFDIGVENLEGKYKEWQKKLHPDLVHSKSEVSQSIKFFLLFVWKICVKFFQVFFIGRKRVCCWTMWSSNWCVSHT